MIRIELEGRIHLHQVQAVAHGAAVEIDPPVLEHLGRRRNEVVAHVQSKSEPAYGFNRGFGHNVHLPVPDDQLARLQENLIRSHASGTGPLAPREVVRAAMFLRLVSLCRGYSGVRPVVVTRIADLLQHDIVPCVPAYGSVGASGDLAPMSHIALALLGEGEVQVGGSDPPVDAGEALRQRGLEPLRLQMKEGLALNNGVQFSTAYGVLAWFRTHNLLQTAAVATAMTTQVMLGADTPFSEALHALRPHPGARTVARWIHHLMEGSPIRQAHASYDIDGEVQDPYNIRCAGQILGACWDLLDGARRTFEIEVNSVTDNPIILDDPERGTRSAITSGGHFHGMPVAVQLYSLVEALGILTRLSNMRCARYVDEARNKGLPSDLKWPDLDEADESTSSAMMIPEYVSAALTNAIWGAAMPTHLLSLSTDAGQEDHVSMSAPLAVRLWDILPRANEALAIELAYVAQAASIRREMDHIPSRRSLTAAQKRRTEDARKAYEAAVKEALGESDFEVDFDARLKYTWTEEQRRLSAPCEQVLERIKEVFKPVKSDRALSADLMGLARLVETGEIVEIVKAVSPDAFSSDEPPPTSAGPTR